MKPLNILFWYRRRPRAQGGDMVALQATLQALEPLNVRGIISDDPACDLTPFDLVHLYNLCDPYSATDYILRAAAAHKAVVVTPIYWSHAQYLAAFENETPETFPELFIGAPTPETRGRARSLRRRSAALLHDAQQLVLRAAASILILSRGEGAILAEEFGVSPDKFFLTYNGVDPLYAGGDAARFQREFGVRDFVLCAARFEDRKNQMGVIRACADGQLPLVLAGAADDAGYFEFCRAHATPNVRFVGTLTPPQVADACAAARVHVLASWWEEVGLAALEAGMAGCNLVMTQNGPGQEYFGDDSFTCNPADPRSIRAAIDDAFARPRATHLAQRIRDRFSWENAARATREAYDRALASASPAVIDPDTLANVTIKLAEELDFQEADQRALEAWALEMQARLQQPPSLSAALRGWYDRLRQP